MTGHQEYNKRWKDKVTNFKGKLKIVFSPHWHGRNWCAVLKNLIKCFMVGIIAIVKLKVMPSKILCCSNPHLKLIDVLTLKMNDTNHLTIRSHATMEKRATKIRYIVAQRQPFLKEHFREISKAHVIECNTMFSRGAI